MKRTWWQGAFTQRAGFEDTETSVLLICVVLLIFLLIFYYYYYYCYIDKKKNIKMKLE